jgi:hypothetical protein
MDSSKLKEALKYGTQTSMGEDTEAITSAEKGIGMKDAMMALEDNWLITIKDGLINYMLHALGIELNSTRADLHEAQSEIADLEPRLAQAQSNLFIFSIIENCDYLSIYLRHELSVVVHLRRVENMGAIRACHVKHPYKVTPDSIILAYSNDDELVDILDEYWAAWQGSLPPEGPPAFLYAYKFAS